MSKRTSTFRPRLDVLEDRSCPSTFGVIASDLTPNTCDTLLVHGTGRANNVTIGDTDLAISVGVVRTHHNPSAINRIEVEHGRGSSSFTYKDNLTAPLLDEHIFVDMGGRQ